MALGRACIAITVATVVLRIVETCSSLKKVDTIEEDHKRVYGIAVCLASDESITLIVLELAPCPAYSGREDNATRHIRPAAACSTNRGATPPPPTRSRVVRL